MHASHGLGRCPRAQVFYARGVADQPIFLAMGQRADLTGYPWPFQKATVSRRSLDRQFAQPIAAASRTQAKRQKREEAGNNEKRETERPERLEAFRPEKSVVYPV
jgi:hypothetical protein